MDQKLTGSTYLTRTVILIAMSILHYFSFSIQTPEFYICLLLLIYLGALSSELFQGGFERLEKSQSSEGLDASNLRERMWGIPCKGPEGSPDSCSGNCKDVHKAGGGSLSQLLSYCHLKGAEAEKERLLISEFLSSAPSLIYYVTSGKHLPISGPWFPKDTAQSLL